MKNCVSKRKKKTIKDKLIELEINEKNEHTKIPKCFYYDKNQEFAYKKGYNEALAHAYFSIRKDIKTE